MRRQRIKREQVEAQQGQVEHVEEQKGSQEKCEDEGVEKHGKRGLVSAKSLTPLEPRIDQLGGRVRARLEYALKGSRVPANERVSSESRSGPDQTTHVTRPLMYSPLGSITLPSLSTGLAKSKQVSTEAIPIQIDPAAR